MLFKKKKTNEEQTDTIAIKSLEEVEEEGDDEYEYEYVDEDDEEYDEEDEEYYRESRKKGIKILLIVLAVLVLLIAGLGGYFILFPKMRYNKAVKYMNQENYEYALNQLSKKPEYKENRTLIADAQQSIAKRAAAYIVTVDDVCQKYTLNLNGANFIERTGAKNNETVTINILMSNELFSYDATYDVDYTYQDGKWVETGLNKVKGELTPAKECDDTMVTKAVKAEKFVHIAISEKTMIDELSLQYDMSAYKHTSATKRTSYQVRVVCTYDISTGVWSVGEITSVKGEEENELYEQKISSQGLAVEVPESWTVKDSSKKKTDPETGDQYVVHYFSLYYKNSCKLQISDDVSGASGKYSLEFGNVYIISDYSSGAAGYVLSGKGGEPEYYYSTSGLSASEIKKIMKTFASRY